MSVTATLPTTSSTPLQTTAATTDGLAGINGDDFMKILVKQLQMQDPMKPMDSEQMIQQMSSIRALEMNTRLSSSLQTLTDQQRYGSAAALIGKYVNGALTDGNGNEFKVEGVVTSVQFTEKGEAILQLDNGQALPMAKLQEVKNANATTTTSTPAPAQPAPSTLAQLLGLAAPTPTTNTAVPVTTSTQTAPGSGQSLAQLLAAAESVN